MASYQDLETRVKTLEDRVEFIMQAIRIGRASPIVGAPPIVMSLFDLYMESRKAGLTIDVAPETVNA